MTQESIYSETRNRSYSLKYKGDFSEVAYSRFLPIHQKALVIAKNLQRFEFEMIEILQLADLEKGFKTLKFKSLFQYATLALGLSEDRAYMFITVARKAANLSLMQEALRKGELKISKAKKISSVITQENQKEWLDRAKNMSQRSLERAIVRVNPKSQVEEGMKFVSEDVLEFRAAIDLDVEAKLKRVQDLLSQSLGRAATYNEVLKTMATDYITSKDPVVRAERVLIKKIKAEEKAAEEKTEEEKTEEEKTNAKNLKPESESLGDLEPNAHAHIYRSQAQQRRQPLSRELKHRVFCRDQGKCQEKYEVGICGETRWLDIHHKLAVSQGGKNVLENLITLCRAHHQMEHSKA